MAKRKSKAKGGANYRSAPAAVELKAGDLVRIVRGDYGNSVGNVERVVGDQVSVHLHGRLTVILPLADVVRV